MPVTLLLLPDGHCSLEFETADIPSVTSAIRQHYGVPNKRPRPTSAELDEYRFGGCSFAFQNEWDDRCLISDSAKGDEILRKLHNALNTSS